MAKTDRRRGGDPASDPESARVLQKRQLLALVVRRTGLRSNDIKPVVEATLKVLGDALASGEAMILPPLGNDFVAMVKDSSLVSVLGVADITQLAKVTAAGNFRYFETYNVAALLYLTMTIGLSLVLRRVEAGMRTRGH